MEVNYLNNKNVAQVNLWVPVSAFPYVNLGLILTEQRKHPMKNCTYKVLNALMYLQ